MRCAMQEVGFWRAGSRPLGVRWYAPNEVLRPRRSRHSHHPAGPQFPVSVLVARPITSNLYRDNRIVYGSGPVQLGTYEFERWAQSPVGMIQDALISSLRAAGQYRSVVRPGSNTKGDYILRTN